VILAVSVGPPVPAHAPAQPLRLILGVGGRSRAQARTRGHDEPSWRLGFHSESLSLLAADDHRSGGNSIARWRRTPDQFEFQACQLAGSRPRSAADRDTKLRESERILMAIRDIWPHARVDSRQRVCDRMVTIDGDRAAHPALAAMSSARRSRTSSVSWQGV
jgi:hypothetical protein